MSRFERYEVSAKSVITEAFLEANKAVGALESAIRETERKVGVPAKVVCRPRVYAKVFNGPARVLLLAWPSPFPRPSLPHKRKHIRFGGEVRYMFAGYAVLSEYHEGIADALAREVLQAKDDDSWRSIVDNTADKFGAYVVMEFTGYPQSGCCVEEVHYVANRMFIKGDFPGALHPSCVTWVKSVTDDIVAISLRKADILRRFMERVASTPSAQDIIALSSLTSLSS